MLRPSQFHHLLISNDAWLPRLVLCQSRMLARNLPCPSSRTHTPLVSRKASLYRPMALLKGARGSYAVCGLWRHVSTRRDTRAFFPWPVRVSLDVGFDLPHMWSTSEDSLGDGPSYSPPKIRWLQGFGRCPPHLSPCHLVLLLTSCFVALRFRPGPDLPQTRRRPSPSYPRAFLLGQIAKSCRPSIAKVFAFPSPCFPLFCRRRLLFPVFRVALDSGFQIGPVLCGFWRKSTDTPSIASHSLLLGPARLLDDTSYSHKARWSLSALLGPLSVSILHDLVVCFSYYTALGPQRHRLLL